MNALERRLAAVEQALVPDEQSCCMIEYDPDSETMPAPPAGCRVAIFLPREAPMSKYELPETEAET